MPAPKTKKKKPTVRSAGTTQSGAIAAHVADSDGNHGVGIWNLHVLVVPDGRFWFAQGLEIDYGVQGDSLEDAKKKFTKGLAATIHHHLTIFGGIEALLKVAPNDVWADFWETKRKAKMSYDSVSFHNLLPDITPGLLPLDAIEYCEAPASAATIGTSAAA